MHSWQVDLLYLHNAAEAQLEKVGREVFMERLKAAFQGLETLRKSNKIRAYGMATWDCFRVAPGSPGYLSLQEVIRAAESVGGTNHGFRYGFHKVPLGAPDRVLPPEKKIIKIVVFYIPLRLNDVIALMLLDR
jgi:hypothetical protein